MNLKLTSTAALVMFTFALGARGNAQPCKSKVAAEIEGSIISVYENKMEPVFTFRRVTPPAEVTAILNDLRGKGFHVDPTLTDLTIDVSFVYTVMHGKSKRRWRLCLSMVGPYATLFSLSKTSQQLITDIPEPQPGHEIKKFVAAKGYKLLDRDTLNCPTGLKMPNTSKYGRQVRFWQALMRDEEELPWKQR